MNKNQIRREIYRSYRAMGYSPAEARKMRGRRQAVISDVAAYNRENKAMFGDKSKWLDFPKIPTTRPERASIRKYFTDQGITGEKTLKKWADGPTGRVLMHSRSFEKYRTEIQNALGDKFDKRWKSFKRSIANISTEAKFWEKFRDFYMQTKGI